jgi:hypothetical protein
MPWGQMCRECVSHTQDMYLIKMEIISESCQCETDYEQRTNREDKVTCVLIGFANLRRWIAIFELAQSLRMANTSPLLSYSEHVPLRSILHYPNILYTRGNKIGRLVYANGRPGGTVVAITLLFTFIMILLTVRLPTHLEQTKSVRAIIYLYVKKIVLCLKR